MPRLSGSQDLFPPAGDPRLIRAAFGGLLVLAGFGLGFLATGKAWWLVPAGLGAVVSLGALVLVDEDRRTRRAAASRRERRTPTGRSDRETPTPTPKAPAIPPESLPLNRTYPADLRALLDADATLLPDGHVWPDLSHIRGSLAIRAHMAARIALTGPIRAADDGAPAYVTYAALGDVATGLHVASLGFRATPIVVFLDAAGHPGLSPAERVQVDDALARAWQQLYGSVLTPPIVLQRMLGLGADPAGPGGAYILELLEQVRIGLRGGRGLPQALDQWAQWRAYLAQEGQRQRWSGDQQALAELLCDWLLVQRACAEDLVVAEHERGPSETRGDAMMRTDAQGSFLFERAVAEVLDARAVARHVPELALAAGRSLSEPLRTAAAP